VVLVLVLLRCTVPPCRPSRQPVAEPPGQPACQSCGSRTSR